MVSRRKFITYSAASALGLVGCKHFPQPETTGQTFSRSPKRGLGISDRNPLWAHNLRQLRCRWFYTWGREIPRNIPEGIEFIPMIWRYSNEAQSVRAAAAAAKKAGIENMLGFNEPDQRKQANMSVEEALNAWPVLMESGMRLGSPGCTHPDDEWMIEFMEGVKRRRLRVDFVCVHSYGGPSADSLIKKLEKTYELFERPLWITEFGVGDWNAKTVEENRHKPERVLQFMKELLPRLDQLDILERYAWFPAKQNNPALGTSALFTEDRQLTPLGECYRSI